MEAIGILLALHADGCGAFLEFMQRMTPVARRLESYIRGVVRLDNDASNACGGEGFAMVSAESVLAAAKKPNTPLLLSLVTSVKQHPQLFSKPAPDDAEYAAPTQSTTTTTSCEAMATPTVTDHVNAMCLRLVTPIALCHLFRGLLAVATHPELDASHAAAGNVIAGSTLTPLAFTVRSFLTYVLACDGMGGFGEWEGYMLQKLGDFASNWPEVSMQQQRAGVADVDELASVSASLEERETLDAVVDTWLRVRARLAGLVFGLCREFPDIMLHYSARRQLVLMMVNRWTGCAHGNEDSREVALVAAGLMSQWSIIVHLAGSATKSRDDSAEQLQYMRRDGGVCSISETLVLFLSTVAWGMVDAWIDDAEFALEWLQMTAVMLRVVDEVHFPERVARKVVLVARKHRYANAHHAVQVLNALVHVVIFMERHGKGYSRGSCHDVIRCMLEVYQAGTAAVLRTGAYPGHSAGCACICPQCGARTQINTASTPPCHALKHEPVELDLLGEAFVRIPLRLQHVVADLNGCQLFVDVAELAIQARAETGRGECRSDMALAGALLALCASTRPHPRRNSVLAADIGECALRMLVYILDRDHHVANSCMSARMLAGGVEDDVPMSRDMHMLHAMLFDGQECDNENLRDDCGEHEDGAAAYHLHSRLRMQGKHHAFVCDASAAGRTGDMDTDSVQLPATRMQCAFGYATALRTLWKTVGLMHCKREFTANACCSMLLYWQATAAAFADTPDILAMATLALWRCVVPIYWKELGHYPSFLAVIRLVVHVMGSHEPLNQELMLHSCRVLCTAMACNRACAVTVCSPDVHVLDVLNRRQMECQEISGGPSAALLQAFCVLRRLVLLV
jgi:hypothetical protein